MASFRHTMPHPRRLVLALLFIGALLAIGVHAALWRLELGPPERPPLGDESMYWSAAKVLAAGGTPVWEPLWPPLYPHLLAAVGRLAPGAPRVAVATVQLLLLLGAASLLAGAWRALGRDPLIGAVLGLWLVADPTIAAFTLYAWPEIPHLFLVALMLWILAARRHGWPWLALFGGALGAALLTKSLLGPFLPVLLVPLVRGVAPRRAALRLAVVLAVAGLVVAPAIATNWRRHRFAGIAAAARFNLWVGLNDVARTSFGDNTPPRELARYQASAPSFQERQRLLGEKIVRRVRERGVLAVAGDQIGRQYFRLLDRDSFLTDQLPGGPVARAGGGYRSPAPVLAGGLRHLAHLSHLLLVALAAAGAALATPRRTPWLWLPLLFLGYNLSVFLLAHVKSRYRVQLVWALLALAGVLLERWRAAALRRQRSLPAGGGAAGSVPRLSVTRRVLAAGAVALALFLALAGPRLDRAAPPPSTAGEPAP